MTPDGLAPTRDLFLRFSEQALGSPMYQALSLWIAADPALLKIAAHARAGQPVANLFLAAVQFLLREDPRARLRERYPVFSGRPFAPEGFFPLFRDFVLQNEGRILPLLRSRLVQTNEVRRCALLYPALLTVAAEAGGPFDLLEVGASGGLNLCLDRYAYRYSDGSVRGAADSPLVLTCEWRGAPGPVETGSLRVGRRLGLDLHPLDFSDPSEASWALSLLWPDQIERIERMTAAVEFRRRHPVPIRAGDALETLPQALADGASPRVFLFHSFTLNQFRAEDRVRFDELVRDRSRGREVWRVSLEWLASEHAELRLFHDRDGQRISERCLATCHPHGEWIHWMTNSSSGL